MYEVVEALVIQDHNARMYVHYVHAVPEESKRGHHILQTVIIEALSHHIDRQDQTQVLCKSNKCP